MSVAEIEPTEVAKLAAAGKPVELIDVRMPVEYQNVHASGAKNFPLDQLDPQAIVATRDGAKDDPLYMICQMGGRSRKACEQFIAAGFPNVVNVAGGTAKWEAQGHPVVRAEKQMMAMDRQVRIAAGALVVAGISLALIAPVKWIGLGIAGFVGAGLVFSGVTNTCGMATLLAMMPWNRTGNC